MLLTDIMGRPLIPGKVRSVHYMMLIKRQLCLKRCGCRFVVEESGTTDSLKISFVHQYFNGILYFPHCLPLNSSCNQRLFILENIFKLIFCLYQFTITLKIAPLTSTPTTQKNATFLHFTLFYLHFLKIFYLFIFRERRREGDTEGEKHQYVVASHIWPETQACALTGNRTGDPLVHRPALNPLNHTSQDLLALLIKSFFGSNDI